VVKQAEKKKSYLDILAESVAKSSAHRVSDLMVSELMASATELELKLVAGEKGLDRRLTTPKVQLLGLALAGFTDDLDPGSAQVLGRAELMFIKERLDERARDIFGPGFQDDIACFLVPENLEIPKVFARTANDLAVPVLRSPLPRLALETEVSRVLEKHLAPRISIHGVLVVVCGLGILITGKSGIGKSDCALDLITHGHQLVADDGVEIRRNPLGRLVGRSKEINGHHMDVRGVGIVNVKELFSIYSVMDEHPIDLLIHLEPWDVEKTYVSRREAESFTILDIGLPLYRLPVSYGRNWVNLIQVAVRKHILQTKGYDAEKALSERLDSVLSRQAKL
jgi:HPr kinase/phosphorylase